MDQSERNLKMPVQKVNLAVEPQKDMRMDYDKALIPPKIPVP